MKTTDHGLIGAELQADYLQIAHRDLLDSLTFSQGEGQDEEEIQL
ncbi:MAG: hypothetical protein OQK73_07390 [Gammaproteobacteria bacterium]|nr:hypothetical protein [Gammaproteobacteria bacterium]